MAARVTFVLTDGHEVFDCAEMTQEEAEQANEDAQAATDGNIYWAEAAVNIRARVEVNTDGL